MRHPAGNQARSIGKALGALWIKGLFSFFLILGALVPGWAMPPALKVTGNQILTASDACTVRLRGVNVDSLEYVPGGNGPSSGGITATVAQSIDVWGANCIRLPLSQDFWFGVPNAKSSSVNMNAYRTLVDRIIQLASDRNAYVILDLHWSGTATTPTEPGETGWGVAVSQRTMPDANAVTFWTDVATRYANHPAVLFNIFNEPYGVTWTVWRDGGDSNSGYQTPGMQALLNTVRATGAHNIVVCGGLDWAYDLSGVPTYHLTDLTGSGVVYDTHIYPWKGSAPWTPTNGDAKITVAAGSYPVLIGEYGQNATDSGSCANCSDAGFPGYSTGAWVQTVISWINLHKYHHTAWDMHTGSSPCLITNWQFTPTTYHGVHVKADLATPVPVADLGCVPGFTATETPTFTPTFTLTPTVTGTIPTNTPTVTRTPTSTPTITMTPVSTTCLSVLNACESLTENGNWWADNANLSLVDSSAAPAGALTEGSRCLKIDVLTSRPWNNSTCNYSGFNPKDWGDVTQVLVDVYADPALIAAGGGWNQIFLAGDVGTAAQTVIATNFGTLTGGANALAFTIRAGALLGGNLTTLYFVYNSQSGGTGALYLDHLRLVRGCRFTETPTFESSPTETRTPTLTPTPSLTPTPTETMVPTDTPTTTATPTGTWYTATFTSTVTPTMTWTSTPSRTPESPAEAWKAVVFPNPVTVESAVGICVGEGPSSVQVRCFSVAYRKVFAVEGTTALRMDERGKTYWGLEVPLKDEAGQSLANGLYHLVVETDQGRRELKLLVMR